MGHGVHDAVDPRNGLVEKADSFTSASVGALVVRAQLPLDFGDTAIGILPLHPKPASPAKRILVCALKHSRAPMRLLPGMVVHRADGSYSEGAQAVLRAGAGISLLQE